jgi:alpha-1,3-rhamnosyltransferase
MEKNTPLVSVCIITYNSAEYIIEALESVKLQSYQNIEIIVADDCSSDNTVEICKKWFSENGDRFIRFEVVVPPHNTGTSANYNRAVKSARGEWLKLLDGDDYLAENCIEDNLAYVSKNPEAFVVFSQAGRFKNGNKKELIKFFDCNKQSFFQQDTKGQLLRALHHNEMSSATFFVKTQVLQDNPYDERYGLLEDAPKWIDLLIKGYRFYFFDKITAYYRVGESVMASKTRYYNVKYETNVHQYFWCERFNYIQAYNAKEAYDYHRKIILLSTLAIGLLGNKRTKFHNFLFVLIRRIIFKHMHFNL